MLTIGHPFELLSSVESTNNYIADHPHLAEMSEGTAILTYHQSRGRGQRDRDWEMVSGEDLAVSYLLRPSIPIHQAFMLNKLIALALRDCISSYITSDVNIKWPNDIFIGGRKVAGMLIEPTWQGEKCRHVIVGIGINVNSDQRQSPYRATSFWQAEGLKTDLMQLFQRLNASLTIQYHRLSQHSAHAIHHEFDQHLLAYKQLVDLAEEGAISTVEILGVDEVGRLRVLHEGQVRALQHGACQLDYSRAIAQ